MLFGLWRVLLVFVSAALALPQQSSAPSVPSGFDLVTTEANVPYRSIDGSLVKINDGHTFETPAARRQLALETLLFFRRYLKGS